MLIFTPAPAEVSDGFVCLDTNLNSLSGAVIEPCHLRRHLKSGKTTTVKRIRRIAVKQCVRSRGIVKTRYRPLFLATLTIFASTQLNFFALEQFLRRRAMNTLLCEQPQPSSSVPMATSFSLNSCVNWRLVNGQRWSVLKISGVP